MIVGVSVSVGDAVVEVIVGVSADDDDAVDVIAGDNANKVVVCSAVVDAVVGVEVSVGVDVGVIDGDRSGSARAERDF